MTGLEGQDLRQYHLISLVGQGGFAAVYRAINRDTGQTVAIKILSPTISGERHFIRRFRREAELVSRLKHPNIVPVIDYDEYRNLVYLVMPNISGGPLKRYLDQRNVPFEELTSWFLQIADAVQYAHSLGVVHRDIKPGNVLIDGSRDARLADFGLARLAEAHSSLTGSSVLGTPAYISPEQAKSAEVGSWTDQYSLGVMLYEIHTGRVPFLADSAVNIILQHIEALPPLPREFNPHIPEPVERIILTALEKDPEDRFGSVGHMKSAYERALAGESLEDLDITLTSIRNRIARRRWFPSLSIPPEERRWIIALGSLALLLITPLVYLGFRPSQPEGTPPAEATVQAGISSRDSVPPAQENPREIVPATLTSDAEIVESSDCPGLAVLDFTVRGAEAAWVIDNGTDSPLELVNLVDVKLPDPTQKVQVIQFGDEVVYERGPGEEQPRWIEGVDRSIAPGETMPLILLFDWAVEPSGYQFTLEFDPACSISGRW